MPIKGWRLFLDTSALMAGIVSTRGAAREVMRLGEAGIFGLVISPQVLRELDRNLFKKFPDLIDESRAFCLRLAPELSDEPSPASVRRFEHLIEKEDRGILAAAEESRVDWLVTWNTRDFMVEGVKKSVPFRIATPGELLKAFEEEWLSDRA